jgi:hypothetical protein
MKIIIFIITIIILTILYSRFISTKGLNTKEYKIINNKITDEYHGLKIVHITDIHYGMTTFEKELENLVNEVNNLKPDVVVFTGDLFDSEETYDKEILINYLSKIEAKIGKYAVSGNHDNPINDYYEVINSSGFINLDDNYELIYNNSNEPIIVSGISTNYLDSSNIDIKTEKFDNYINNLNDDDIKPIYSILLMHEPDFVDNIKLDNYDLVLSGHSHLGQVRLPIIGKLYTPYGSIKYYDEYYKINNTDLYISGGIGTSLMKFRFFDKPSINLYRITNK